MSGKKAKREAKLAKQAARERARREERQRTIFTLVVIGIIVAIGGVLVAVSLPEGELADDLEPTEAPTDEPAEAGEASAEIAALPVACGAERPAGADEAKGPVGTPPPEGLLEEGADYRAVIDTSCGEVVLDLAEDRAPQTVANFVHLAQQGFFDSLAIFRNATSIGALQTGSGTNDAAFDIGYTVPDELALAEEEGYPPGSVAMANAGPGTAGSQFFFVYNDRFTLDPAYTRFGLVTEGLDVLQEIGAIPAEGPQGETPTEVAYIESVTIQTGDEVSGEETPDTAETDATPTASPSPPADATATPSPTNS